MRWWQRDNLLWLVFLFDGEPADLPPLPRDARLVGQRTLHGQKTFSQDTYHLNSAGQIVFAQSSVGNPAKDGLRVTWTRNEPENILTRSVLDADGPLLQTFTLWHDPKGRLSGVTLETTLEDGSEGDDAIYHVRQTKNKVWCDYGGDHQYTFNATGFLTRWENPFALAHLSL